MGRTDDSSLRAGGRTVTGWGNGVVAAEAWRPGQGVLVVHSKLLNFAVLTALTVTSGAWFRAPADASEPSVLRAQILVNGNSVAAYKPVVVTLKLHNPSHAP